MRILLTLLPLLLAQAASSETFEVSVQTVTEWKPVFGQVETRDRVPARARIGGTVATLSITEGDEVKAGETLAMIEDAKLGYELDALDARLDALRSRQETARSDLARGEKLFERGVITNQRLEELQTAVSVLEGEISGAKAERSVVQQRIEDGEVTAPETGIVLSVPVSPGSVVTAGEAVAEIGGGGVFLRLAVPERFAADLAEGDRIEIGNGGGARTGVLAKLYPQIEGGRVQADVEVGGLDSRFVGRRVPVRLPIGTRETTLVPQAALSREGGLDFVTVTGTEGPVRRVVVPGRTVTRDGIGMREILSGLQPGETVVTAHE